MECLAEMTITKISPIGNLSDVTADNPVSMTDWPSITGFTLLEMMVVLSLIGLTLLFAIPRFQINDTVSELDQSAQKFSAIIRFLKEVAVTTQADHTLYIDLEHRHYWVVHEAMTAEAVRDAAIHSKTIPAAIEGIRVTYADKTTVTTGIALLQFFKQGYSNMAWIHLTDKQSAQITILLPPFMGAPRYVQDSVGVEN